MTIMKLSERAVLVRLRTGAWTNTTADKKVTEEVSIAHNAELRGAGSYGKRLVNTKFLSHVGGKLSYARTTHNTLTLPWNDDGTRIITTRGYTEYMEHMRLARQMVEAAAREFVAGMPTYIDEARTRLGDMFDLEDYPTADEVQKRFYVQVDTENIPEGGDFRASLSAAQVKAVVKEIEGRTTERIEQATKHVFERIADVTGKMAERLREYDAPTAGKKPKNFKASLVGNVKELAEALPLLNITGDKRLDKLQAELLTLCDNSQPDLLRVEQKERKKALDASQKIFDKVSKFL